MITTAIRRLMARSCRSEDRQFGRLILPKELLARLKLSEGDSCMSSSSRAGHQARPYDPSMRSDGIARARSKYADTYKALAK